MSLIKYFIACLLLIVSTSVMAVEAPTFKLPYGQWRIISLPATPPGSANTLGRILGDDVGTAGNYGQNWAVYAYDTNVNGYGNSLSLTDRLEKGKGYWIIQLIRKGVPVTLKMPDNSSVTSNDSIPLTASKNGSNQWNLAGNPFATSLNLDKLRLTTNVPSCRDGSCNLDKAEQKNLLHNKVWIYNGTGYKEKGISDQLNSWNGFWVAALGGSTGRSLELGTIGGIARAKIAAYAEYNVKPAPTIQDYADAGVNGVTAENLAEVNAVVEALDGGDVDTIAELNAIVAGLPGPCITLSDLKIKISNNEDVTEVNTGCITNMSRLFSSKYQFNQDISNWDVSNVTNMKYMFSNAKNFNQDISSWDVSNVTDMTRMFKFALDFNQDISGWNVGNVTRMLEMFESADEFNQDIGYWNVGNVTTMGGMFKRADSFNRDIGSWNVSKVTDMSYMFQGVNVFNQDIGSWNVGKVTTMSNMFNNAYTFNQNISSWNVSNVSYMSDMFDNAYAFNQKISSWDVSSVKNMNWMFGGAKAFDQDLSTWNIESTISMRQMFSGVTLSTANYSNMLISWAKQNIHSSVTFDGGNSKYSLNAAASRQILINKPWYITDGGLQ